jgi:hypothetical protein
MTPEEVIREMRSYLERYKMYDYPPGHDELAEIEAWAESIEAAMREPVAEIEPRLTLGVGLDSYCQYDKSALEPGTKLFAFPPDAAAEIKRWTAEYAEYRNDMATRIFARQAEIEQLQESCRRREDRAIEASHQARVLANVCADQKREIERLREALQQIANRAIPIQREEHRIARAALAATDPAP